MAPHFALADAIADGSSNCEQNGSSISACGQGIGSLSRGAVFGAVHPIDTMWKHSGYIVTLSCKIWDHGFSSRAIGNATGQECFVKGCEITGEVGGIALSVALIGYSAFAKIGNGCHAAGRAAWSSCMRTFSRPTRLAMEMEKKYVVTETVTTGVGQGASRLAGQNAVAKEEITETVKQASRKRFVPDIKAEGAHTVFRRNPETRRVTHYETYKPQTNPNNPNPWESDLNSFSLMISEERDIIYYIVEDDRIHQEKVSSKILLKKPLIETDLNTRLCFSHHLLQFLDSFKEFIRSARILIKKAQILSHFNLCGYFHNFVKPLIPNELKHLPNHLFLPPFYALFFEV